MKTDSRDLRSTEWEWVLWRAIQKEAFKGNWKQKAPKELGTIKIKVGDSITVTCEKFDPISCFYQQEFENVKWVPPPDDIESGYLEFVFKNYCDQGVDHIYRIEPLKISSNKRRIRCHAPGPLPEDWEAEEGS